MWNLNQFSKNIVAVDEYGQKKTYAELSAFSDKVASLLPKRSLIFSFCENSIGSLFGYVAFTNNESVPLLLSSDLDIELAQELIERYQPTHYWLPEDKLSSIDSSADCILHIYGYALVKTQYDSVAMFDDLALLLTTSGSTGSPKLVKLSYKNIESNAASIADYLELNSSERPISSLPMHYSYGLSVINSHLMVGATILLTTKSLLQREFWDFFKQEQATSIAGVPYNYQMLKRLRFFKMKLPSLRYLTQAGGKLDLQLHQEFAEYAKDNEVKFFVMYGQTEATARMGYLPWKKSLDKCGLMGIAIPNGEFYLIDANGNRFDNINTIGELVYVGENVSLGYSEQRSDLLIGDIREGILHTGDMAQVDEDGYYKIVGRKKRFIKLFGNRVNLDSVEHMLHAHFTTFESVCVGNDDKMFIFITDDSSEKRDAVRNFVTSKTGIHFSAFKIESIESIPKNDSGKIQYKQLPY